MNLKAVIILVLLILIGQLQSPAAELVQPAVVALIFTALFQIKAVDKGKGVLIIRTEGQAITQFLRHIRLTNVKQATGKILAVVAHPSAPFGRDTLSQRCIIHIGRFSFTGIAFMHPLFTHCEIQNRVLGVEQINGVMI